MRHFDEELEELNNRLLEMSGLVESSIHRSVNAVINRDGESAQVVFQNETRINQLEILVDETAIVLLALQQPLAVDLRFITMAMKINNNLERMGDVAVDIAERAVSLLSQPQVMPHIDIPYMATLSEEMIQKSLDAFVRRDVQLARNVLMSDDAVDNLRDSIYRAVINFMEEDSHSIHQGLDYLFVARGLERLADHATNIAEDVLFYVQGVDVRHQRSVSR